jgi:hypothetical protein
MEFVAVKAVARSSTRARANHTLRASHFVLLAHSALQVIVGAQRNNLGAMIFQACSCCLLFFKFFLGLKVERGLFLNLSRRGIFHFFLLLSLPFLKHRLGSSRNNKHTLRHSFGEKIFEARNFEEKNIDLSCRFPIIEPLYSTLK